MNACVYAALHVIGLLILWGAVVAACAGTSGLYCALAVLAGAIVSYFFIRSFIAAYNRCRAGR